MKVSSFVVVALAILSSATLSNAANYDAKVELAYPKLTSFSGLASPVGNDKVQAMAAMPYPEHLKISLPVKGDTLELDIHKATIVSPNFVESVLDVDPITGEVLETNSASLDRVPTDCYYTGHVTGQPNSIVSIDVCSGYMKGALHTKQGVYSIEKISDHKKDSWIQSAWDSTKALFTDSTTAAPIQDKSFVNAISQGVALVDVIDAQEKEGNVHLHSDSVNIDSLSDNDSIIDTSKLHDLTRNIHKLQQAIIAKADDIDNSIPENDVTDSTNDTVPKPDTPPADILEADGDSDKQAEPVPKPEREKRWVEVLLFSDNTRYKKQGSELSANTMRLFNNVASYYRNAPTKYEINMVLKGHYVFNRGDPYYAPIHKDKSIHVMGSRGLLQQFLNYVTKYRKSFPTYDISLLLSERPFQANIRGLANVGGLCAHPTLSGGINQITYTNEVMNAVLVAHEAAHNLNALHDSQAGPGRSCPGTTHIMGPYVSTNTEFSKCSIRSFDSFLARQSCIRNNPLQVSIEEHDIYADAQPLSDPNEGRPYTLEYNNDDEDIGSNTTKYITRQEYDELVNASLFTGFIAFSLTLMIAALISRGIVRRHIKKQEQEQGNVSTMLPQTYQPAPMVYRQMSVNTNDDNVVLQQPPVLIRPATPITAPFMTNGVYVSPN